MIEADETLPQGIDKSWIVLETLLCMLRENNILKRSDIEELCERVERRASTIAADPLPCCKQSAAVAAAELNKLSSYIGHRYGGKHKH
jgi:hypothetical protein